MRTAIGRLLNTIQKRVTMQLRIPRPTPCPPEALEASGRQTINHRGKEFLVHIERVTDGLKTVYQTKNDVFILTGSGTGGLEVAVVNTLSPGDRVLSATCGVFSDRFADIAEVVTALGDVVPRARRGG